MNKKKKKTTIDDLLRAKSKHVAVAHISPQQTVLHAIRYLAANRLYALPVLEEGGVCYGFIDWLDIMAFIIKEMKSKHKAVLNPHLLMTRKDIDDIMESAQDISVESVGAAGLVNYSKRDPFFTMDRSRPLDRLYSVLSQLHHIGISCPNSAVMTDVVTQRDVIHFLARHPGQIGKFGQMPISKIDNLYQRQVLAVREVNNSVDCFEALIENKISGAGVVTANGNLCGNISASDIKKLADGDFDAAKLLAPVSFFASFPALQMTPDNTLNHCIKLMSDNSISRVYIIVERLLCGVISIGNVLDVLAVHEKKNEKKNRKKKKKKKGRS